MATAPRAYGIVENTKQCSSGPRGSFTRPSSYEECEEAVRIIFFFSCCLFLFFSRLQLFLLVVSRCVFFFLCTHAHSTRKLSFCCCCPFLHSQFQHLKESLVCESSKNHVGLRRVITCPEHGAVKKSSYQRSPPTPNGCVWDKYKWEATWRESSIQSDKNKDRCHGKFADTAPECLCKVRDSYLSWVTDSSVCKGVGGKVDQSKQPPLCCPLNSKGQMECEGWETVKSCMEKGFAPCKITDLAAPSPSSKDLVTKCSYAHGKCRCDEGEFFLNLCFDYIPYIIFITIINLTYMN